MDIEKVTKITCEVISDSGPCDNEAEYTHDSDRQFFYVCKECSKSYNDKHITRWIRESKN